MARPSVPLAEARLLSVSQVGTEWGISRDKARKLLASVQVHGEKNGHPAYAIRDVARVMVVEELGLNIDGEMDPSQMIPKDRKDWFDSELKRISFEEKTGELLEAETHRDKLADALLQIKAWAMTIADRLERDADLSPRQVQSVQDSSDRLLTDLYETLKAG